MSWATTIETLISAEMELEINFTNDNIGAGLTVKAVFVKDTTIGFSKDITFSPYIDKNTGYSYIDKIHMGSLIVFVMTYVIYALDSAACIQLIVDSYLTYSGIIIY